MGIRIQNVRILGDDHPARRNVYIEGNRIVGIDREPAGFAAEETIDCVKKILMPGLVNTHTHAYMSVFRNFADDLPFETWLFDKITPLEDRMTAELAYWGNLLSIMEMLRTGTTCFVDMQMFPRMAVKACAYSGIRAVISRGLVGADRQDPGGIRRMNEAFDEMAYAASLPDAPVSFALGPHAIYTCGEDFLRYVAETAKEKGLPVNMHLSETRAEFENCLKEHGKTPAAYIESLGLLDGRSILAHCVYLADEDYEILKRHDVTVALNPASNMKLANGFAPVPRLLREGIRVSLGTDGASSNNSLNMFREMNLLSLSQKGAEKDPLVLTADETVQIAVKNGYAAIGMEREAGRVEEGCIADLILLDEDAPNFHPKYNWNAALAYSSTGYEVTDVIVNGKILMRDRVLTTIDEERVRSEMARIAEDFQKFSGK